MTFVVKTQNERSHDCLLTLCSARRLGIAVYFALNVCCGCLLSLHSSTHNDK